MAYDQGDAVECHIISIYDATNLILRFYIFTILCNLFMMLLFLLINVILYFIFVENILVLLGIVNIGLMIFYAQNSTR